MDIFSIFQVVLNEPSVFEPLKFYCSLCHIVQIETRFVIPCFLSG